MTVYERTKKIADERGLSLQQVANKAGLGINSIYSWKKKDPSISRLAKVATVLGVSVDHLLGETDKPSNNKKAKPVVDLNKDDAILTFDGKPIPEEDMELIKRLLGK
ncbi:MAG: helix-turn-helix transcriptional regulator [Lentilactobacillus buchneri]|jgi:transcriptional regulator with XRE-family HTH domain|nr:helix-turn-helix transcriptional regulator [Lentilactobacillus buchneri]MCI1950713.1 helix-turn-helix transcriptional regulator [Lentilactobacillus buchneri]MCI2018211.1 helix-turn-helix transcriptional regulator [Lentilactobacillus buchneri]MCI2027839.1 helix-turn-helix transcriptional regulator [Lentilactobacillus buchneri]